MEASLTTGEEGENFLLVIHVLITKTERSFTPDMRSRFLLEPSSTEEEGEEEFRFAAPESKLDVSYQVAILKTAAKSRKVPATEVLAAINAIENAKVDPSNFLQQIGGRSTRMLIFTVDKELVKDARVEVLEECSFLSLLFRVLMLWQ